MERLEKLQELTAKEREILRLRGEGGLSNQEIADQLVVNLSTVKTHINNIRTKLKMADDPEADYRTYAGLLRDLDEVQTEKLDLGESKGEYAELWEMPTAPPPVVEEPVVVIAQNATPMPHLPRRRLPQNVPVLLLAGIVTCGIVAFIRTGPTLPTFNPPHPEMPVVGQQPIIVQTPTPTPLPIKMEPPISAWAGDGKLAIPMGATMKTPELCRTEAPKDWVDWCLGRLQQQAN